MKITIRGSIMRKIVAQPAAMVLVAGLAAVAAAPTAGSARARLIPTSASPSSWDLPSAASPTRLGAGLR